MQAVLAPCWLQTLPCYAITNTTCAWLSAVFRAMHILWQQPKPCACQCAALQVRPLKEVGTHDIVYTEFQPKGSTFWDLDHMRGPPQCVDCYVMPKNVMTARTPRSCFCAAYSSTREAHQRSRPGRCLHRASPQRQSLVGSGQCVAVTALRRPHNNIPSRSYSAVHGACWSVC